MNVPISFRFLSKAFCTLVIAVVGLSQPLLAGWEVRWIDRFDGSNVDWNNWHPQVLGNFNSENQCYTADDTTADRNFDVSNGTLKIIARQRPSNVACPNGQSQDWTSGRLTSKDKREFKYGRIESRIRMVDSAAGTWPAFWMLENRIREEPLANDDDVVSWPNQGAGEIDVWEWIGSQPDKYITNFLNPDALSGSSTCGTEIRYVYPSGVSANDFHNYAMEWTADEISFYIDNTLVVTQDMSNCAQYQEEMFILINLAMGGTLGGNIALGLNEARVEFDYVSYCTETSDNNSTGCNESTPIGAPLPIGKAPTTPGTGGSAASFDPLLMLFFGSLLLIRRRLTHLSKFALAYFNRFKQ